ncbi:MAG: hypothetical protein MI924_17390 [Chloroflexales bacterium]|nr:hypothetical protein [Chloroflexales bacterium]
MRLPRSTLRLDWGHLRKRCAELASMVWRGRTATAGLLRQVYQQRWRGDVPAALEVLEAYRPEATDWARLAEWMSYLQAQAPYIPNYRRRRCEPQDIGSGPVDKVNDLLVARRQNGAGMRC